MQKVKTQKQFVQKSFMKNHLRRPALSETKEESYAENLMRLPPGGVNRRIGPGVTGKGWYSTTHLNIVDADIIWRK